MNDSFPTSCTVIRGVFRTTPSIYDGAFCGAVNYFHKKLRHSCLTSPEYATGDYCEHVRAICKGETQKSIKNLVKHLR